MQPRGLQHAQVTDDDAGKEEKKDDDKSGVIAFILSIISLILYCTDQQYTFGQLISKEVFKKKSI